MSPDPIRTSDEFTRVPPLFHVVVPTRTRKLPVPWTQCAAVTTHWPPPRRTRVS